MAESAIENQNSKIENSFGRLKLTGILVLLVGLAAATLVYWLGTRSRDLADDPSMAGFYKADQRQMEILYGPMGRLTQDLLDDLKRPGTQAAIIVVASVLISAGCFYFARFPEHDGENVSPTKTNSPTS